MQDSYLSWAWRTLGPIYGPLILASAAAVLLGALAVVTFSRRPAVIAAFLVFLPLPLLIAVYFALSAPISSLSVIAATDAVPKASEIAGGVAGQLLAPSVAMLVSLPSYIVLALGLVVRTIQAGQRREA